MPTPRHEWLSVFLLSVGLGLSTGAGGAEPADSVEGYATFSHPIGVEFRHPQSWTVFESVLGLQVGPPDVKQGPYGPAEAYIFAIIGADPSVSSLTDPRAAQLLNGVVTQSLPFLRPRGDSRAVDGIGRVFSWNGRSPEGVDVECHVYGLLSDGYFISLTALGDVQAVRGRTSVVERIFRTVKLGEPRTSPQLVGTWYSNRFSSSGTYGNRVNTATQLTMTLLPDGRLASSAQTGVHGWSRDAAGGPDRPSISGVTEASTEEGRWAISGDALYLLWKDVGAVKWSVYIQGSPGRREMLLTPATGGEKVLWTEYPDS